MSLSFNVNALIGADQWTKTNKGIKLETTEVQVRGMPQYVSPWIQQQEDWRIGGRQPGLRTTE